MRLRTDFKYALIDQYTTYWNAFDNTQEFYSDVMATDKACFKYTMAKTNKIKGLGGTVSQVIYSQNELWVIHYADRKDALEAIDNITSSDVVEPLEKKRYTVASKIVDLKRAHRL